MSLKMKYALGLASLIATLALATPLSPRVDALDPNFAITDPTNGTIPDSRNLTITHPNKNLTLDLEPISPTNYSAIPSNLTSSNDIQIRCDGRSYSNSLDIADCEEARAYFPPSSDPIQWALRHTTGLQNFVPLPYRSMGNQGVCYIQPILLEGTTSATATPDQVRTAAAAIQNKCTVNGVLAGGIATGIGKMKNPMAKSLDSFVGLFVLTKYLIIDFVRPGGDNNLAVIMGAYEKPKATCGGSLSSPYSCKDILNDMLTSTEEEVFDSGDNSSVTVQLPYSIQSGRLVQQ